MDRYVDTAFVHDFHVAGKNIECGRCHTAIQHRLPPPIGLPKVEREPGAAGLALRGAP